MLYLVALRNGLRERDWEFDAVRFAMLRAAGLEWKPKVKLATPVEIIPFDQILGMNNTTGRGGHPLHEG